MGVTSRIIDRFERKFGEKLNYMRDIANASPSAFYKFALFMPFAKHHRAAPLDAYFLSSIGALQHEDCGPCLQIAVDQALAAGLRPEVVSAAIAGDARLTEDQKLYLDFGRAVAANAPETEDMRQRVAAKLPPTAMVDLAIAISCARVFPALKRALGHAQSCALVKIRVPDAARKAAPRAVVSA
jgi:hypothetical protein